jgi:hypothetical protein
MGALASVTFSIMVVAYIQSEPNTTGVAVTGAFDRKRAFADLKQMTGFGPRPSGSPALERTRAFTPVNSAWPVLLSPRTDSLR